MKVAPLIRAFQKRGITPLLIHTGQHEGKMSDPFLQELGLTVDYQLSHPALDELTRLLGKLRPALVIVVGDVDSTLDGAIATKINNLKLAHIEAGLRSFDRTMKEELNRIAVDELSDYLFVSEESGMKNLDVPGKKFLVGNIMIDNLPPNRVLITLHRPSNVDNKERLKAILESLKRLNRELIWPMHPRTAKNIQDLDTSFINIIPPVGHTELVNLIKDCEFVVTDSGGISEEAVYLGRRVYTLRDNTERPLTLEYGNTLVTPQTLNVPLIPLWDGNTAERIVNIICQTF